ncbi:MAG: type IV toxin-antitoxin system AbiEi family antitoxin domain-containing protein [Proteobacteria bacterium]|nr:type IV toxin-antitoxin system AbiEi family antitoxin domain-containing protein [Pseudomonadota bacterium]
MPKEVSQVFDKIIKIAKRSGVIRIRDLIAHGIHPEYARRFCNQGLLIRSGRGLYVPSDLDLTENHTLAEASKRVPSAVVSLLTALRFHNLGTQIPHQVWMAIDRKATLPKVDYPPLRFVRFSGQALKEGIEIRKIEGVEVKVYNPPKTVADCFKYRNKIGLDVALEALRECWRERRCTMDQLWYYAKVCRVSNVMRPYLESLT